MDVEMDLAFPLEGVDETRAFNRQRQGTTVDAQNVRAFEPITDRARGGVRPGLSRYVDERIVGNYPIQNINHIQVTVGDPPNDYAQFTRAEATDQFAITDGADGSNIATGLGTATYEFACSCWDDQHCVYVAEVEKTTTGNVNIFKYSKAGVLQWSMIAPFQVATGSLRNVAGMVVVNTNVPNSKTPLYLFVAVTPPSGTAYIHRINAMLGTVNVLQWQKFVTTTHPIVWSTASHNNLGKINGVLGVESKGNGTNQGFYTYNAYANANATRLTYTAFGGTAANQASKVISDGQANFYAIVSRTANMVWRLTSGGVQVWGVTGSVTSGDTANSIALDVKNAVLAVARTTSTSVRTLSIATGATVLTADPGSVTNWHEIDTDGQGTFVLWRNGVASNDIMTINTSLTQVLAPATYANTTHTGSSVNRGDGPPPTSPALRQTRLLVTSNGEVRRVSPTASTAITNGQALTVSPRPVFSAQNGLNLYYVDGESYYYYASATDTMTAWTASSGSMPTDDLGRKARLICTYRGRTVLAGVPGNPGNFYMSAMFDPRNWDYSPAVQKATQAFSGNNDIAGELGDLINSLVPYNDDTMLFLCDSTIWQMSGDPMSGGSMDRVSGVLGGAFGRPYCIDPAGQIYFFGTDCRVYKLTPGSLPVCMSQQLNRRFGQVNLLTHIVFMAWDTQHQGVGVWVTPYEAATVTTNFFWEERTNAWWPDFYGDPKLNPLAVHTFDGDAPNDRAIMVGGRDGYLRVVDRNANTDNGHEIEWFVMLGPIKTPMLDDILFVDMQAMLGDDSSDVTYEVFSADTPEAALALAEAGHTGTFAAGQNNVSYIGQANKFHYVNLTGTGDAAIEKIIARYRPLGFLRRRFA